MDNKKEKIENFKTAISSTVKSISNSQKIEVSFGNEVIKSDKNLIKLPEIDNLKNKINVEEIRGIADSKSLQIRFSNEKTLKKYEPKGNISKKLYNISEKIRCEKIGTNYFKGVKNNIEKFYQKRISGLDLKSSEDKILESFENYLRVKFLDFKNESQLDKKLKSYKKDLNEQFKNQISKLKDLTLKQEEFNSLISQLISEMSLDDQVDNEEKRDDDDKKNDKQSNPQQQEKKTSEKHDKFEEMSIDSSIPDLENQAQESNKAEDDIEIQDNSRPELKKKLSQILVI